MLKQKTAWIAALLLLGAPVMFGSTVANAATPTAPSIRAEHDEGEEDEFEEEDQEEHEHHGSIPPVVIRPHADADDDSDDDDSSASTGLTPAPAPTLQPGAVAKPRSYDITPVDPTLTIPARPQGENAPAKIDPQAAPAIDAAGIRTSTKTPADIFMESATLGVSAMGIGALAFGGVASVRAIRLRKNPNGDYFYEGDN